MRAGLRAAALVALSLVALPSVSDAQQRGKVWRVGVMATLTPIPAMRNVIFAPLIAALHDLGYDEGRNIVFELRSAEGDLDRLPNIAAELVTLPVDVFICPVCGTPLDVAMHATKSIPIVVTACDDDMVEIGVAASVAHPGGNVTGISKINPELSAKRLELLKEMVPTASQVGVIWDPKFSTYLADWRELRSRASGKGVTLHPIEAHVPADLDKAFTTMASERVDAALHFSDVLTYNVPDRLAKLAIEHKIPFMSAFRETTKAGGLMSYGPSIPEMQRQAAVYVDKIFKGEKPGDLPIQLPVKFDTAINLKSAKILGLEVPPALLVGATEVVE
jgi:putative ABC transport system substrate-binding protein